MDSRKEWLAKRIKEIQKGEQDAARNLDEDYCLLASLCPYHLSPDKGILMAPRSHAVERFGAMKCDLCGKRGSEKNPLTLHHIDGNSKNNDPSNKMAVHRVLCHTFADFVTQTRKSLGLKVGRGDILSAWMVIFHELDLFGRK